MKRSAFYLTILLFSLLTIDLEAQDFLSQFKGNKDSLKAEALKLINLPDPTFKPFNPKNIDAKAISEIGFEQIYKSEPYHFVMKDGKKLVANRFPKESNSTIVLVHGVGSSSFLYNKTAGLLQEATQAEVYSIDLRGHGMSEGIAGDVDYIDQYADDLADIILALRKTKPKDKIIIAGHSMGGGITLRFAMNKDNPSIDGFLFFAPLLGQNSPTIPKTSTSDTTEAFLKFHTPRYIGLKMMNAIQNHEYDSLHVLFLNLPESTPLRKYTFRANESMAPEDYKAGLKAIKKPMLTVVGSNDEAFIAKEFINAINKNSKGKVIMIEGATHNGIRHNTQAMVAIKEWFGKL